MGGAALIVGLTASADVGETVNYTYDVHGRLLRVERSGTVNNGVNANYAYDKADNRTNVNVSGSPN